MAPSSKKNRTASGTKNSGTNSQKRTRKRTSSAKKRQGGKRQSITYKRIGYLFLILFGMAFLVGVGYCIGQCWIKNDAPHKRIEPKKQSQKQTTSSSRTIIPQSKKPKPYNPPPALSPKTDLSTKQSHHVKLAYRGERPKLVIIIDDVHTAKQLEAIQSLPMPVTPSIFPPYTLAPHTPKLATHAVHYMIHLPMESGSAKFNRQSKTLMRSFSKVQMEERVKEIRRLFPRAHYINNHTGSRFTEDKEAVARLYEAMKAEGFAFIDSRTTGHSKVKSIAHAYGDDYVARDIFLDNVQSVPYIHTQLKKAVRLAKKNGYAIAIGHPHHATMEALRSAKPLLKEVEVVYIDEIFREN